MATGDPTLRFVRRGEAAVLEVSGTWTVLRLGGVRRHAEKARAASGIRGATAIDARGVERLDTAGVLEILSLSGAESDSAIEARDEAQADLFRLVRANLAPVSPAPRVRGGGLLVDLGQGLADAAGQFVRVSTFFGEVMAVLARAFLAPRRFRPPAVVAQAYEVWIRALGIVGVLCFLIGVVLAYQGVQQLRQFGAETFTVETVGISIFRELGVLLTAIIVAGRSGSAFTAQLGTMQVNQEIDAMRTMGLNPVEWLVLPRILALTITMPLLAFWGNMAGILGGAFACSIYLDLTLAQYFERLRDSVGIWHIYTGMIKAPVFAFVIATVGCYNGLQVKGSAESVGQLTTRAVVQSIFAVIVLDAIFSVIFLLAGV